MEAIIYILFIGGYSIVKDIGRAYGWWPDNFLSSIVIAVILGVALGLTLRLTEPKK